MDKELVAEWLKFADADIDTVLLLKEVRPQHREIICYHCAQAVEKYLKGFLVSREQIPPKIHDLTHLCNLCSEQDQDFTGILPKCSYLKQFGVQPRYPKEMNISDANVEKAIKYALAVRDFATIVNLKTELGKMIRDIL
ncbi:MAG: HEPN domain-containing protein [Spirochaetaceae bacterium]|nr:HEPN domain-containing protein [Spirochaetaceae bacterium]